MANRSVYLEALREARGGMVRRDYSVRPLVKGDVIGICSDVHIPFHDERLVAQMLETFSDRGVDTVVWLGDLLDLPYFSKYDTVDPSQQFIDDLGMGERLIRLMADIVKQQIWSSGNHDIRALRKMGFQIRMYHLAQMMGLQDLIDDASLLVYDSPTLQLADYDWTLTHPDQYGSNPLVVPGKLAEKWHTNVIAGHAHHWGQGVSPSGEYQVVESGGLFDPRLFEYVQWHPAGNRAMMPGYWILDHGIPMGFLGERRD